MQRINDTMFDNPFVDHHRIDYSKSSDSEDNVDDEIILYVSEFRDAFWSNFVVSHDWAFSHRCMLWGSDLEVSRTFNSKNKLVNIVKHWHITHSVEYRVQQSNSTFSQLQFVLYQPL